MKEIDSPVIEECALCSMTSHTSDLEMWAPAYIAMQDDPIFRLPPSIEPSYDQEVVLYSNKEPLHQEETLAAPLRALNTLEDAEGVPASIDYVHPSHSMPPFGNSEVPWPFRDHEDYVGELAQVNTNDNDIEQEDVTHALQQSDYSNSGLTLSRSDLQEPLHQEETLAAPLRALNTLEDAEGVPASIDYVHPSHSMPPSGNSEVPWPFRDHEDYVGELAQVNTNDNNIGQEDVTHSLQQSDYSNSELTLSRSDLQESTAKDREVQGASGRGHSEKAISIMRNWFDNHSPYVDRKDKEARNMASNTGLYWDQVQNWFSNERYARKKNGKFEGIILKPKASLTEQAVSVLKEFQTKQGENPSREQKEWLAREANLDLDQVSNWFAKSRKKRKTELPKKH